jgi:hypothetical protein
VIDIRDWRLSWRIGTTGELRLIELTRSFRWRRCEPPFEIAILEVLSRSSHPSTLMNAFEDAWFTCRLLYASITRKADHLVRRLGLPAPFVTSLQGTILLQTNRFLHVYVAISTEAVDKTPASGPIVRQRSNALKRLPTSSTVMYQLLYLADPPDSYYHRYRVLPLLLRNTRRVLFGYAIRVDGSMPTRWS